jgi:putative membrane protein
MNRRNALMTLSGAMATSALMAVPRTVSAQSAMPKLDHTQYVAATLMLGTLSKEASALALQRARHPKVKQFAEFEIAEQTTMAQVLTDNNNPPPARLDSERAQALSRLTGASDKEFDTAYIRQQLTGHAELLDTQQEFLNNRPSDDDPKHIAMLARTVIQMHITMLQDLESEIRT